MPYSYVCAYGTRPWDKAKSAYTETTVIKAHEWRNLESRSTLYEALAADEGMDAMVRIQHSDKPYSHQMNALHVIHDRLRAGDQYLSGADKQLQTLMLGNRLDLLEPVDIFASIRDEIAAPLNRVIYKGRLKNHPSVEQRPVLEELKTFTLKTLGAAKYSLIVDVKNTETSVVPGTQSKYNPIIACVITNIVKMYTDAFPKLTMAIITCYNAQYLLLLAIRDVMAQEDKNGKTYFISQLVKAFLSHSCKKKVLLVSPNNNGVNSLCIAARSAIADLESSNLIAPNEKYAGRMHNPDMAANTIVYNAYNDCDLIVVDEACRVSEPASRAVDAYNPKCKAKVYVGDKMQLKVVVRSASGDRDEFQDQLLISEMNRLQSNGFPTVLLDTQYRMVPENAAIANEKVYHGLLKSDRLDLLEPVDIFASIHDEIAAPEKLMILNDSQMKAVKENVVAARSI
jgi:hypothetical protein